MKTRFLSGRGSCWRRGFAAFAGLLFLATAFAAPEDQALPAPDFPPGLDWLNVDKPLSLADLRGKVVILDFWTYGCINCIHVMEELARLRQRFGHQIAVIGVHSPKFDHEADPKALRRILARYQRDEPVVNDPEHLMMRRYGVRAWPTLAVIDPSGRYVGKAAGEGQEARLALAIEKLLALHQGQIDDRPLALSLDAVPARGWFAAPEKIATGTGLVAISDSRLHRILVTDVEGRVSHRIGGPEAGFQDGGFVKARFRAPRGLVFDAEGRLYVADTGNHAIRRIDLKAGQVVTLAGTGRKGLRDSRQTDPLALDLRSPWDLALDGNQLYIAMAGDHRIWRLDLVRDRLAPFAGSGHEGIDNGDLADASFSQPSGLALRDGKLYVADPEASAVREIDLAQGRVSTLAGRGLFDFGDRDGPLVTARLQHAQAVLSWGEDQLLIADTYNHKLKRLDLTARRLATLLGDGQAGSPHGDLKPGLDEPGGLARLGDQVLIADTNNGRILAFDPATGKARVWEPRES